MSDNPPIFDADEANFPSLVLEQSRKLPVLVDFWASWCAPCRALAPILESVVVTYRGRFVLAKVDTDRNQKLAAAYRIRGLPTLVLFKDAMPQQQLVGMQSEPTITSLLERYVARESDDLRGRARMLWDSDRRAEAIEMLRSASRSDPANYKIHADLIGCLLENDEPEEASALLESLPPAQREEEIFKRHRAQLMFARAARESPSSDELEAALSKDPGNCDARFALSARLVLARDYEGAMDELLEVMRRDRNEGNDRGRKGMLAVFDLLGGKGPLVSRYRARLSSVLH